MRTRLLISAFWLIAHCASNATASYRIDYVVNPFREGVSDSWMFDINEHGKSTGYVVRRDENGEFYQSPVIYRDGEITELARRGATFTASTTGLFINDGGDVVAKLSTDPPSDSYRYFADGQDPVSIVDAEWGQFEVRGLNNAGQVLLCDYEGLFVGLDWAVRLKIWSQEGTQELTQFDSIFQQQLPPDPNDFNSGPSSFATPSSITNFNDAGQFASGRYFSTFDPQDPDNPDDDIFTESRSGAFVYDGAGGFVLLEEPSPGATLDPHSIGDDGVVFGFSTDPTNPSDVRLALWNLDGTLRELLPDPGQPLVAYENYLARNDLGQVLALTADQSALLLYDPQSGVWTDIIPDIVNLGEGSINEISAFNNQGQFVGLATHPNTDIFLFGFVASPVPEPTGFLMAATSLAAAAAVVWRRKSTKNQTN